MQLIRIVLQNFSFNYLYGHMCLLLTDWSTKCIFSVDCCKSVWKSIEHVLELPYFLPVPLYHVQLQFTIVNKCLLNACIRTDLLVHDSAPKLSWERFTYIHHLIVNFSIDQNKKDIWVNSQVSKKLTRKHHCSNALVVIYNHPLETWNWKLLP